MLVSESPGSVIIPDGIAPSAEAIQGESQRSGKHHSSKVSKSTGWLSAPELMHSEGQVPEFYSEIEHLLEDQQIFASKPYDAVKRAFDLIGAATLLTALAPAMVVVAALVKVTSAGPVIYSQKRLTLGGKVFTMFKFRTMRTDAEDGTGAVWAADADPRITPLGRVFRKTRLDELPQLFNVIAGDMSLIGPRPERPELAEELEKLLPGFQKRLAVRAGISGLAQVASGYAACVASYRRKLAFDLYYVAKRSFLLDLQIALKTVTVIITGQGAR